MYFVLTLKIYIASNENDEIPKFLCEFSDAPFRCLPTKMFLTFAFGLGHNLIYDIYNALGYVKNR